MTLQEREEFMSFISEYVGIEDREFRKAALKVYENYNNLEAIDEISFKSIKDKISNIKSGNLLDFTKIFRKEDFAKTANLDEGIKILDNFINMSKDNNIKIHTGKLEEFKNTVEKAKEESKQSGYAGKSFVTEMLKSIVGFVNVIMSADILGKSKGTDKKIGKQKDTADSILKFISQTRAESLQTEASIVPKILNIRLVNNILSSAHKSNKTIEYSGITTSDIKTIQSKMNEIGKIDKALALNKDSKKRESLENKKKDILSSLEPLANKLEAIDIAEKKADKDNKGYVAELKKKIKEYNKSEDKTISEDNKNILESFDPKLREDFMEFVNEYSIDMDNHTIDEIVGELLEGAKDGWVFVPIEDKEVDEKMKERQKYTKLTKNSMLDLADSTIPFNVIDAELGTILNTNDKAISYAKKIGCSNIEIATASQINKAISNIYMKNKKLKNAMLRKKILRLLTPVASWGSLILLIAIGKSSPLLYTALFGGSNVGAFMKELGDNKKMCKRLDELEDYIYTYNSKVQNESALTVGVAIALGIVPMIKIVRQIIYFFYYSKIKASDILKGLTDTIEYNRLEMAAKQVDTNDEKQKKKLEDISKKQMVIASKLGALADKLKGADSSAKKAKDEGNKFEEEATKKIKKSDNGFTFEI